MVLFWPISTKRCFIYPLFVHPIFFCTLERQYCTNKWSRRVGLGKCQGRAEGGRKARRAIQCWRPLDLTFKWPCLGGGQHRKFDLVCVCLCRNLPMWPIDAITGWGRNSSLYRNAREWGGWNTSDLWYRFVGRRLIWPLTVICLMGFKTN